ncbi:MAG: response regulator [Euryarchaeota archaeon]|nr:response regulator [Euryarchaeota archaeon]
MEYSILLIDDEESIHQLLPYFLVKKKKHRFTVHSAVNGKAGVEMYSKLESEGQKPDFVLMDLRMPVMDGVEATKRVIEKDPGANIYLFTAYTNTQEERDALKAGAKLTISKDADWHRTVENILNVLESGQEKINYRHRLTQINTDDKNQYG